MHISLKGHRNDNQAGSGGDSQCPDCFLTYYFLGIWPIPCLRQEMYERILKHFVILDSEEALEDESYHVRRAESKRRPPAKGHLSSQQSLSNGAFSWARPSFTCSCTAHSFPGICYRFFSPELCSAQGRPS